MGRDSLVSTGMGKTAMLFLEENVESQEVWNTMEEVLAVTVSRYNCQLFNIGGVSALSGSGIICTGRRNGTYVSSGGSDG